MIEIQPKNTVKNEDIEIEKDVTSIDNEHSSYDVGQEHSWIIQSSIPSGIGSGLKYEVRDTLDERLTALRERSVRYLRCALENVPFTEEAAQSEKAMLAPCEKCTGCAACANICAVGAITMVRDKEGFLVPRVDKEKCVGCGVCQQLCRLGALKSGEEA